MKTLNQYITEKLVNEGSNTFEVDIDAASSARELLRGIKEVYGKTGISAKDGKYSNVIFSCKTLDDFLKLCGMISVAWNQESTDSMSMMPYNGDEDDSSDLAFYVPGYGDEIESNIKQIEKYAKLWIKWFENNEFNYDK